MPPKRVSTTHTKLLKSAEGMSIVARHSIKNEEGRLLQTGVNQAYWAGQNLPSGFNLEVLASRIERAQNTGNIAEHGYNSRAIPTQRNKQIYKSGLEKLLSSFDSRKPIEELKKGGEELIKDLTQRVYAGIGKRERPLILSITHDGAEYAILSAVRIIKDKADLETKFGNRKPTKVLKDVGSTLAPTEGILFYFLNEKNERKIVLSYRKQSFDITKEIKRILSNK